jgi:hypothetical protein
MQVTLKPRRIVLALSAMVTLLTLANVGVLWIKFRWQHDSLYGLTPLFDFNREGNLPAFYSACALLFAAVLLLVIAGHAWERDDRWRRHWTWLGIIFVFLAVDEAAELHGLLSLPIRQLAHTSNVLFFAWVVPYAALTLLFAVTYLRFFWALPGHLRTWLGVAGVIYVTGALGFEVLAGAIVSSHGGVEGGGLEVWQHAVSYTVEELMEMTGVLIAIHALLQHIMAERIAIAVRVSNDEGPREVGTGTGRGDARQSRR